MRFSYFDSDIHLQLLNEKLAQPFLFIDQVQRHCAKQINFVELYSGGMSKMNRLAEGNL